MDLQAGALRTHWAEDRLGPVFVDGHEVWHGVHVLLRDAHWRTPPLRLSAPRRERTRTGWRLVTVGGVEGFDAVSLRIEVEGSDDGRLTVTGDAHIGAALDVNRLGLCLLHPLAAQGRALEVRHDDGRVSRSSFPERVPAWPPFTAIQAIGHEFTSGAWAMARFEGDSFELEDQRNNADASFKTYSRSNFMPRPYRLSAGDRVRQRVQLSIDRHPPRTAPAAPVRLAWPPLRAGAGEPLRVGLELTAADLAAGADRAARLPSLRPDFLHLAVPAGQGLAQAPHVAALLRDLQAGLRLDIVGMPAGQDAAALARLQADCHRAGLAPAEVAVFPSSTSAVQAARAAFATARVGGGSADFFVQLNRAERLPRLDFLSFTVCPIVHSADDATVMDSHRSLPAMLATLADRYPGVPVHLGPSRISARRSPLGDLASSDGRRPLPLAGLDPRDDAALGAAWMAAHLAAAVQAGVGSVTFAVGAGAGPDSPVAALLGLLGQRLRPAGVQASFLDPEGQVAGLAIETPAGVQRLVVNGSTQPLAFEGLASLPPCSVTWLRGG